MKEIKLSAEVLRALRETSGYNLEEIAKKLKTSKEKIVSVEVVPLFPWKIGVPFLYPF